MAAAEDVKRQIAVAAVVTVEEPALLPAVDRIVRSVEVEHDLLRCPGVRLQEDIDEQRLDRRRIMADLVVARRLRPAQLQSVQRRLPRRRRTVPTPGCKLAHQHRHRWIVPQPIVIVEVLIAQRLSEHPLPHQRLHLVFHQLRPAAIAEAAGKPAHQPQRTVGRAQQHRAAIRRDRSAVERRFHTATFHRCKTK